MSVVCSRELLSNLLCYVPAEMLTKPVKSSIALAKILASKKTFSEVQKVNLRANVPVGGYYAYPIS